MKRLVKLNKKVSQEFVDSNVELIDKLINIVNKNFNDIDNFILDNKQYSCDEIDHIKFYIESEFEDIVNQLNKAKNQILEYEIGVNELSIYDTIKDLYRDYKDAFRFSPDFTEEDINEYLKDYFEYEIVDNYTPFEFKNVKDYFNLKIKKI